MELVPANLTARISITVIVVTHDVEIARHAGRLVVLHDGNILCDTPDVDLAASTLHSHVEAAT